MKRLLLLALLGCKGSDQAPAGSAAGSAVPRGTLDDLQRELRAKGFPATRIPLADLVAMVRAVDGSHVDYLGPDTQSRLDYTTDGATLSLQRGNRMLELHFDRSAKVTTIPFTQEGEIWKSGLEWE